MCVCVSVHACVGVHREGARRGVCMEREREKASNSVPMSQSKKLKLREVLFSFLCLLSKQETKCRAGVGLTSPACKEWPERKVTRLKTNSES